MTSIVLNDIGTPVSGNALALDPMLTVQRERAADWATARLWGSTNGVPGQGNRRMVAKGETIIAAYDGTVTAITVATHDTGSYKFDRYLI